MANTLELEYSMHRTLTFGACSVSAASTIKTVKVKTVAVKMLEVRASMWCNQGNVRSLD
jgi:hypothetical protein